MAFDKEQTQKPPVFHREQIISHRQVQRMLNQMAQELIRRYPDPSRLILNLTMEGAARTGTQFHAALYRHGYDIPQTSTKLSSYRESTVSNGDPEMLSFAQRAHIEGMIVINYDDIFDTGHTTRKSQLYFIDDCGADEVVHAYLLAKMGCQEVFDINPDLVGWWIPAYWVFGEGIDDGYQRERGLNGVHRKVEDEEFYQRTYHLKSSLRRVFNPSKRHLIRPGLMISNPNLASKAD